MECPHAFRSVGATMLPSVRGLAMTTTQWYGDWSRSLSDYTPVLIPRQPLGLIAATKSWAGQLLYCPAHDVTNSPTIRAVRCECRLISCASSSSGTRRAETRLPNVASRQTIPAVVVDCFAPAACGRSVRQYPFAARDFLSPHASPNAFSSNRWRRGMPPPSLNPAGLAIRVPKPIPSSAAERAQRP